MASWPGEPPRAALRAHAILLATLALPLVVFGLVGRYARYTADDYCWAGVLRTEGFFKAQVLWYTGYSPRFAFTFLVNVVELAGPAIVPALPAIAILVWLATLVWALAGSGLGTLRACVLAEGVALATFQTAPDLPQSLYWQTGMLTYLLPLVLATFFLGWLWRAVKQCRVTWRSLGVAGLVTFVAGGLSETYLIPQNVGLTLGLLACLGLGYSSSGAVRWWSGASTWRTAAAHLAAGLAGGVLALVLIVIAPSTASRVDGTPADLWLASSAAVATAFFQVVRLARYFPFTILLCLGLPGLVWSGPARPARLERTSLALVTVGIALTLPFCYFPSFYAQNGNPPARSLIVPGAMLIGYLVYVGYAFRGLLQRLPSRARMAIAMGLALVPIGITIVSLPQQAIAAQHAALWDAEDQQIRANRDAGQADVTVPSLPTYLGENFVTSDPRDWFNVCVARYYGVRSIAASP